MAGEYNIPMSFLGGIMKTALKKHFAFFLALLTVTAVCFLFAVRKEGLFIDEVYTYGLSNSYYAPFVADLKDGDMIDKVITRQELFDYLTVNDSDKFSADSVYYNQTRDVHPPLYYWLFNFASSLNQGSFSLWTGLILDFFLYFLTLVVLYALVIKLFDSGDNAAAAVLLYGLSSIGLSTMIMIRMYVLLTLETVLLGYLIVCLMRNGKTWHYPAVAVTVFAGMMTQYYYVFYAFFVCLAFDVFLLIKRKYREFIMFSLSALCGVLCLIPAFPAFLKQLTADALVSGGSAMDNFMDFGQYAQRITLFVREASHRMKAVIYAAGLSAALCIALCGKIAAMMKKKEISAESLVLIIPALVTFFVVAIVSPVTELRYIYNIVPMLVLTVSFLIYLAERGAGKLRHELRVKKAALLLAAAIALWEARCVPPDYLYDEYSDYDALLAEHKSAPCIYIDDNFSSPLTYDMLQIMIFDELMVTNDASSEKMLDYIGQSNEAVVFIDISKDWASGYDAQEVLEELNRTTGLTSTTPLYSNGFSDVYLLSR